MQGKRGIALQTFCQICIPVLYSFWQARNMSHTKSQKNSHLKKTAPSDDANDHKTSHTTKIFTIKCIAKWSLNKGLQGRCCNAAAAAAADDDDDEEEEEEEEDHNEAKQTN